MNSQPSQWNHIGQPAVTPVANCTQPPPSEENPAPAAPASRTCTTVPPRPSVITEQKPAPAATVVTPKVAVNSVPNNCYSANDSTNNSAPVVDSTVINNTVPTVVNNCNITNISTSDSKNSMLAKESPTPTVPPSTAASPVQESNTTESLRRQRITRSGKSIYFTTTGCVDRR